MSRRESGSTWLIVGALALLLWSRGKGNGGGGGSGGGGTRKPVTKGKGKSGDGVIDVDSPKRREATPEEKRKAQKPPGMISASPELEAPRHGQTPAGYDAGTARASAQGIAAHLAAKGPRAYDRNRLALWQTYAGLRADGNYGGSTRGALVHYGVKDPPRPFLSPYATLPYHPPE